MAAPRCSCGGEFVMGRCIACDVTREEDDERRENSAGANHLPTTKQRARVRAPKRATTSKPAKASDVSASCPKCGIAGDVEIAPGQFVGVKCVCGARFGILGTADGGEVWVPAVVAAAEAAKGSEMSKEEIDSTDHEAASFRRFGLIDWD